MLSYTPTPICELSDPILSEHRVRIFMKREDLNHPYVSGNKWWKLKYNLEEVAKQKISTILTFGGAYSNHIHATAAAARECGLKSIGIIRGEKTLPLNKTLAFTETCGMKLIYVSREEYRNKSQQDFISKLNLNETPVYVIPEGGSNDLAIKGVEEFADTLSQIPFQYLCVPLGTGCTAAGLINILGKGKQLIGFSSLKGGEFLRNEVDRFLKEPIPWHLETAYHFGGYGKVTSTLLRFLNDFEEKNKFRLDPIYTGKMMAGIFNMIQQNRFPPDSIILALHTGGLQGWNGFE